VAATLQIVDRMEKKAALFNVMATGGGAGPVTRGGALSFSFDGLEANGANTQPQVIRVPGGNSSLMTPGIAAGDVAVGRMQMIGTPVDL
jgi:hypothetical protein